MRRAALLVVLLLALPGVVPGAAAQVFDEGLVPENRHVELLLIEARGNDGWTVREHVSFPDDVTGDHVAADFWLPDEARNVDVTVLAAEPRRTSWHMEGSDRGRVVWDAGNGTADPPAGLRIQFTVPDRLPAFTAAAPVQNATVRYLLLPGTPPPEGLDVEHRPTGGERDVYVHFTGPLAAGDDVRLSVRAPLEAASLSLVWTLLGTSALVLLAGILWSRRRTRTLPQGDDMGMLDHLRELQVRLIVPIAFFGLLTLFFFTFDLELLALAPGLQLPVPRFSIGESVAARVFQSFAEHLVPPNVELVVVRPMDAVMAEILITIFLSLLVTMPLFSYEIGAFLAPALYPEEKKYAWRAIPLVTGLFVVGCVFAYAFLIPVMLETLYEYADALGATSLLAVEELVGFTTIVILVFGLAFELPLAMMALSRFGLVQPETFASKWRHATVAIFFVAAIVTPDPSVVNQVLVAIPMLGLYVAGVFLARAGAKRADVEDPAAG